MTNDGYDIVSNIEINKSMIRKIGDNEFLKIIPQEKIVQITRIEQEKITKPIKQTDQTIINAYPKKIVVYRNQSQDNKYETMWETVNDETFEIPVNDIKTIYNTLKSKDLIVVDNMLNLSNAIGMVIKQHTLEEKIESIKENI